MIPALQHRRQGEVRTPVEQPALLSAEDERVSASWLTWLQPFPESCVDVRVA